MLQVMGLVLTSGQVKLHRRDVPASVDVDIKITKMTKQDSQNVALEFEYNITYKKNVATVKVTGIANCRDNAENIKKALSYYKKKKALPPELGAGVINMINANAGLNSIFLIRPFNLIPPFMPPALAPKK